MKHYLVVVGVCLFLIGLIIGGYNLQLVPAQDDDKKSDFLGNARQNARQLLDQGEQIFRFDTMAMRLSGVINSACIRSWRRPAPVRRLISA